VGIVTAESKGYFVPVTDQIKIVTVTSFSLPAHKLNGSIVPVTCPLQKIETVTSFSLPVLPKNYSEFIVLVSYPPKKLKRLHRYRSLAF
jgi:hypothetical protein